MRRFHNGDADIWGELEEEVPSAYGEQSHLIACVFLVFVCLVWTWGHCVAVWATGVGG
jgi:hypothetical protein